MIYLLILLLTVILFGAYVATDKDIVAPPVLFVGPFLAASICAGVYRSKWKLDLHFNTFCVLLLGCLLFTLGASLVHVTVGAKYRKRAKRRGQAKGGAVPRIDVPLWKILAVMAIQAASILIVSRNMRAVLAQYGVTGDFSLVMLRFRELSMFSEENVTLSSLSSNIRLFSIAVSYIWIYIICNNFIGEYRDKNRILMLCSVVLGIVNSVILGSRGEAIQLLVAMFVCFLMLKKKYNGWKSNLKFSQLLITVVLVFALMYGFKAWGNILGRGNIASSTKTTTAMDELAKYLGAEIKNLDLYLENPFSRNSDILPGSQTFGFQLGWLNRIFNQGWKVETVLPFQRVNNISLGNVYTTFYAYIFDFDYVGMFVLTLLASVLSQLIYERSMLEKKKTTINFGIIVNSYVLFLVAFSFFGERFFTYVFNISFIKYLVIWALMIRFCTKNRVRFRLGR